MDQRRKCNKALQRYCNNALHNVDSVTTSCIGMSSRLKIVALHYRGQQNAAPMSPKFATGCITPITVTKSECSKLSRMSHNFASIKLFPTHWPTVAPKLTWECREFFLRQRTRRCRIGLQQGGTARVAWKTQPVPLGYSKTNKY